MDDRFSLFREKQSLLHRVWDVEQGGFLNLVNKEVSGDLLNKFNHLQDLVEEIVIGGLRDAVQNEFLGLS